MFPGPGIESDGFTEGQSRAMKADGRLTLETCASLVSDV